MIILSLRVLEEFFSAYSYFLVHLSKPRCFLAHICITPISASLFSLLVCLCVQIYIPYKDTGIIGLGPTLLMLSSLNYIYCCCLISKSCLIPCDPMDCSTPGFPVLYYLLEFAQTQAHEPSSRGSLVPLCFLPLGWYNLNI